MNNASKNKAIIKALKKCTEAVNKLSQESQIRVLAGLRAYINFTEEGNNIPESEPYREDEFSVYEEVLGPNFKELIK